jgi:CheY-like chemotaxis protein
MSPWPDIKGPSESVKTRVLVVDDEPTLRLGFAYALADSTTLVETAATGRQALDCVSTADYDVIILDLRMPELDGIGVISALREVGNSIPIVLCSAALSPAAALRAIRMGVVDFLLKPVRPMDLRQVVRFVVHPETRPFSLAMIAARDGRYSEAIQILEKEPTPNSRMIYWLSIFRSILNHDPEDDSIQIEEQVRTSLSILAFNSPAVS